MSEPISLRFEGPYSWTGGSLPSVSDCPESESMGLYIWAVPTAVGELVQYIGQTGRSFRARFADHLRDQSSGPYRIYDAAELREGRKLVLWPGIYGPSRTTAPFVAAEFARPLQEYVGLVRFYLARLDAPERTRCRIEGALAANFQSQPAPIGTFYDEHVQYKGRLPNEEPFEIHLTCPSPLRGFPEVLTA
jgi:hypothetical protein